MKLFFFIVSILFHHFLLCQGAVNYTVLVSADVQKSPPQIRLNWNYQAGIINYQVFRKMKTGSAWGAPIASLSLNDTTYFDATAVVGVSYEYLVAKNAGAYQASGFINAGIEVPLTSVSKRVLLLVDSNIRDSLKAEIEQWITNAELEGWNVTRIDVSRSLKSNDVKDKIVLEYQKDPENTKSVFILGHVAVPYSGFFKPTPPDAHAEHIVAWPADAYYADMDGMWSDDLVDDTTGAQKRNWNRPNDGVWDQTMLGSDNSADIAVGRVDFFDMPAFAKSEATLLKDYLKKLHEYKMGTYKPKRRALIDDNFGAFSGEAFSASGWGNFSTLVGRNSILNCDAVNNADYLGTMDTASYLWSYGCGAGSYTSCSGVGSTANFASRQPQTVFTMLFGSYFGDWDNKNNVLRAALAHGKVLTNVWSGRPRWFFHHMALGGTIGESTILSQNNKTPGALYNGRNFMNGVHVALLGDPTLKLYYIAPPKNLATSLKDSAHSNLTWTASTESVLGYNIYRKRKGDLAFIKINNAIISTVFYTDSCIASPDTFIYQIRAVNLETTPSGSYFNESIATSDTFRNAVDLKPKATLTVTNADPNYTFTSTSLRAKIHQWTYSDTSLKTTTASSTRKYSLNGDYWILLTSSNQCGSDTQKITIKVTKATPSPGNIAQENQNVVSIYPNPFKGALTIISSQGGMLKLLNLEGRLIHQQDIPTGYEVISLDNIPPGIYHLEFTDILGRSQVMKLVKD